MFTKKINTIFTISILAIAGIGISYAGFTDEINLYGTVNTGTVTLEIVDYSCTLVWKIWDYPIGTVIQYPGLEIDVPNEIAIYRGICYDDLEIEIENEFQSIGCQYEFLSYARATPGTTHGDKEYDIDMEFDNIFPCIDFTADFIMHYTGSIPAKINDIVYEYLLGYDFTPFISWKAYRCYPMMIDDEIIGWEISEEIVNAGYQLHYCNYVYIEVTIHLPQENILQGQTGEFSLNLDVIQWNDLCDDCNLIVNANGPYDDCLLSDQNSVEIELVGTGGYNCGSIVLFEWDFEGDGVYDWSSPSSGIALHSYGEGLFNPHLRVTVDDGTVKEATTQVNITTCCDSPIADANGPYYDCPPVDIVLDGSYSYDPVGNIISYEWDLDDDGLFDDAFGMNPTTTWDTPGDYPICLKVTNDCGEVATDCTTVRIEPCCTDVYLIPPIDQPCIGDTFDVLVDIDPSVPIGGYKIDIGFCPYLEAVEVIPGPIWDTATFSPGTIDNVNHEILGIEALLMFPSCDDYPDTYHTAFTIRFTAIQEGVCNIDITEILMTDCNFEEICTDRYNTSVDICGGGPPVADPNGPYQGSGCGSVTIPLDGSGSTAVICDF